MILASTDGLGGCGGAARCLIMGAYRPGVIHPPSLRLALPRGGILVVGWASIQPMTSASVQVRNRPIMRPGGKPRVSIQEFKVVQVRTMRSSR